jgi:site-specific recombinase XerD
MILLNNSDINKICLNLLEITSNQDLFLHMIFETLYSTGLRINEVLEPERWTSETDNIYICRTEKKSDIRTFNKNQLSELFADLIFSDSFDFLTYNFHFTKISECT